MILSDRDIVAALEAGEIEVSGAYEIQPASIDLHLSDETPITIGRAPAMYGRRDAMPSIINPTRDVNERIMPLRPARDPQDPRQVQGWTLPVQGFALASTSERVRIGQNHVARLEGKSSLARLGLMVHITAGFFDPGFEGYPTLELYNCTQYDFLLIPGMPICQMAFEPLSSPCAVPYSGKYVDQGAAPQASRYHLNFPL